MLSGREWADRFLASKSTRDLGPGFRPRMAFKNWFPTRRMGLMTGDRHPAVASKMQSMRTLVAMALCGLSQHAPAQAPPQIGLLDARRPDAAVAIPPGGAPLHQGNQESRFAFLALDFKGGPAQVACCIQLAESTESDWMQQEQVLQGQRARFTPAQPDTGFAGLVLPVGTVITRQRGSTLWLRRAEGGRPVHVRYCTSAEGLHVSWQEEGRRPGRGPVRAYYLYLGMELVPNCPRGRSKPPA